ncbi:MAG: type IX secretion system membrane protein PorP/SprF [Flavobacteriales bacterium]
MKYISKIKILALFMISIANTSEAQQEPLYNQYLFNHFAINPAYAGSREAISANVLYRDQWVGFNGAPTSQTFNIHGPFKQKNFALGLNAYREEVGPTENISVMGTYAYHLRLGKGKLSLALRGGFFNSQFNSDKLNFRENGDRFAGIVPSSAFAPTFDFGAYYYGKKTFIGFSATHLTEEEIGYEGLPQDKVSGFNLKRHFMLSGGRVIKLNDTWLLKPSTLVKYVGGAPLNVDLNISALYNKLIWVGVSYRSSETVVGMLEFNITDYLRVGYSYGYGLSELQDFNQGTHELFVGADFSLFESESVSPRNF